MTQGNAPYQPRPPRAVYSPPLPVPQTPITGAEAASSILSFLVGLLLGLIGAATRRQ